MCVIATNAPFIRISGFNTALALTYAVGCCTTTDKFAAMLAVLAPDTSILVSSPP